jgi:hypothetical protein
MIVKGHNLAPVQRHTVDFHQLACGAGILGGDQIGRGQDIQRAQRDIARRPDRGRDEIKTGREWLGQMIHGWTLVAPAL